MVAKGGSADAAISAANLPQGLCLIVAAGQELLIHLLPSYRQIKVWIHGRQLFRFW